MADGSLTIPLNDEIARKLAEAAEQAGETPDAFALRLVVRGLEHGDWDVTHRRLDAYDRTGEATEAAPVLERFLANVRRKAEAALQQQK